MLLGQTPDILAWGAPAGSGANDETTDGSPSTAGTIRPEQFREGKRLAPIPLRTVEV